jgi:hypothetical protein
MLQQKVFIYNNGSAIVVHDTDQYDFDLYFEISAKAPFLRLNDYITAANGYNYKVIGWSGYPPSAFGDGGRVTVQATTNNVAPAEDSEYSSLCFTPDLVDYNPAVSTYGTCENPSTYNTTDFEFNLKINVPVTSQANKVAVDDYIVDSNGIIYRISYLSFNGGSPDFTVPIRVVDIDQTGTTPTVGNINIWRASNRFKLSAPYGNNISQEIINKIRNRDNVVFDTALLYAKERIVATLQDETNAYLTLTNSMATVVDIELRVIKNGLHLDWEDYLLDTSNQRLSFINDEDIVSDDKFLIYYEKKVKTI